MSSYSAVLLASTLVLLSSGLVSGQWWHRYGYCPYAEWIIRKTVEDHFRRDNTIVAGVLRLHFHDCFVDGCDGSILLDGPNTERHAPPNEKSARGFEVIEDAKARVEAACPGIMSCADILALAARDSSVLLGGPYYRVPIGRYDGRVSSSQQALDNLPSPLMEAAQLKESFRKKGLSEEDLVLLSGGHTIGTSKCALIQNRLYNFSNTGRPDPRIDATFLVDLQRRCPPGFSLSPTVELDRRSEFWFDNSYYRNLVFGRGVLTSDQTLAYGSTANLVQSLAENPWLFAQKYTQSMIKMGSIGWKTKYNGEIRKECGSVNA